MEKYLVRSIIQSRKVTLNSITRSTASPKTSILNPFHMRDREYTGQICVIIKIRENQRFSRIFMECSAKITYKQLKRESDNGNIITKRGEGR
ncbi:Uncharacterised protein [Dorea longicatena]|nr:Uncharacterised protein [Dorea longicatena]